MTRNALLLCAGFIIAVCSGCVSGPTPGIAVAAAATPAPVCSANDFAKKIAYFADATYQPGPGIAPPMTTAFPPGAPNYVQDLVTVFNANPPFQQQLCKLDAVYINGTVCTSPEECSDSSWGWRQSRPTIGSGRVVALSAALWKQKTYSQYETDLMQTVLPVVSTSPKSGAFYSSAVSCSAGKCADVDTPTTALMAALAHEMGHVLWYDLVSTLIPTTGGYTDPNGFCGGAFFRGSWRLPIQPPPRWRSLLTPQKRAEWGNNWPNMHNAWPHVRDIDKTSSGPDRARQALGLFGSAQPWVSAFAAVSPDEDFVETYKFMVLASATQPLTSVKLTIPTQPVSSVDIAADFAAGRKAALGAKVECIRKALADYR